MWDWSNRKIMGIPISRFGASWLHVGGDFSDQDGFVEWMTTIPFDVDGEIRYISEEDANDAYEMMSCGKMELEQYAEKFLKRREANEV